jgi:hypothetical protein
MLISLLQVQNVSINLTLLYIPHDQSFGCYFAFLSGSWKSLYFFCFFKVVFVVIEKPLEKPDVSFYVFFYPKSVVVFPKIQNEFLGSP